MKLTKKTVRQQISTMLNMLAEVNESSAELEEALADEVKGGTEPEIYELFDDIRCNQIHDIDEIMGRLKEIGALKSLPDEFEINQEILEKFKARLEAKELIKEAISLGVLQAAGSKRVYVYMHDGDDDSEESGYWVPELLDDAALSLAETNSIEMLRERVEEVKKVKLNG